MTRGRTIPCAWRWCNMSIGNLMPSAPLAPFPVSTTAVLRRPPPGHHQLRKRQEPENPPVYPFPFPQPRTREPRPTTPKMDDAKDAMQYLATPSEHSQPPPLPQAWDRPYNAPPNGSSSAAPLATFLRLASPPNTSSSFLAPATPSPPSSDPPPPPPPPLLSTCSRRERCSSTRFQRSGSRHLLSFLRMGWSWALYVTFCSR